MRVQDLVCHGVGWTRGWMLLGPLRGFESDRAEKGLMGCLEVRAVLSH